MDYPKEEKKEKVEGAEGEEVPAEEEEAKKEPTLSKGIYPDSLISM